MNDRAALWILIGLIVLGVIVALAIAARRRSRDKTAELRERFGPEYDRAVEAHGNVTRAERDLAARERRVERFHFRELTEAERSSFSAAWERVQTEFVDDTEELRQALVHYRSLFADLLRPPNTGMLQEAHG